jgi:hypothetical protein
MVEATMIDISPDDGQLKKPASRQGDQLPSLTA